MMPTTENITELSTHAIEHHEVFYKSAEFWVGASFVLVVALLYKPLINVIKSAIFSRIERIKNELQEAEELKLKAQELYAKYERNLLNIDDEIAQIIANEDAIISETKERKLRELNSLLNHKQKEVDAKIESSLNKTSSEIRNIISRTTFDILKQVIVKKLSVKDKSSLIDKSIKNFENI